MKRILISLPMLAFAGGVSAGGWEASKLDTAFMYKEGGYGELSYGSLDYNIKATATNGVANVVDKKTAKAQTRTAGSFKMDYGNLDIGLTSYTSGAIQMQGGAGLISNPAAPPTGATFVPDADAILNSTSLIAKYNVSESLGLLLGATQNTLQKTQIKTQMGTYDVKAKSTMGSVYGIVYEQPEIALRVELLMQPKSTIKANSSYNESGGGDFYANAASAGASVANVTSFTTTLSRPETVTLNFQSGVATDTLLYGSIHKASWKSAQIIAATGNPFSAVSSDFTDTTTFSLGVGRKISDSLSLTSAYTSEAGSGKTGTSLFTQTNGYQGISIGARYTVEKMTISCGYSYNQVGDVTIGGTQAIYKSNNVSAIGLKVGFNF